MSENPHSPPPSLKHELRTPLNHIIGYCEMLTEEAQDRGLDKILPDLERIHTAGRRLLAVINDICDPEKLPVFRASPALIDHDVRTPLNQIIGYAEMLQEEARDSGEATLVPDLERIHAAARELLRRVLVHFAPVAAPTSPAVTAAAAQAKPAEERSPAPLRPASPAVTGKLLVVDDDEGNREMLARRLKRLGHQTVLASNGREALERLRAAPFDLMLLDIQMPELNGYEVLHALRADAALSQLPVIVLSASDDNARVASCIEMGAEDYLPKPFDPVLLRARIGACLEKKRLRESERAAFAALQASESALSAQLNEAARYVQSLLPAPLADGPVRADWRFLPSDQLGGDAFGYHWLDPDRMAVYVLDVCGHGVGAALLSVSVMNVIKSRSIPNVDFADPAAVLAGLNRAFPMEAQNNMFFTIWYGVLNASTRELCFACGGHPPALLRVGESALQPLTAKGGIIGFFPEAIFANERMTVPADARLYVFSDGLYEIERVDGSTARLEDFTAALSAEPAVEGLAAALRWARGQQRVEKFADDVSLLEVVWP